MPALSGATDAALRSFFDADLDGKVILDRDGRTLFVNERHLDYWGGTRDDHRLTAEERSDRIRARVINPEGLAGMTATRTDAENTFTWIIPLVDGRTVEVRSAPVFGPDRDHLGRSYTTRDITAQVAAEAAHHEQEERYRKLVASLHVGVVLVRPDRRVDAANPAAASILGLSEDALLGRSATDLDWHPMREDGREVEPDEFPSNVVFRTGQPCRNLMLSVESPGLGLRWLLFNAYPVGNPIEGVMVTFQDVTDRREARTEALREQNAAAFKTLVGGVATRLNAALAAMTLGARQASSPAGLPAETTANLARIVDSAGDAAEAVNELLALAGNPSDARECVDVAAGVRDCLAVLGSERRERIVVEISERLPRVKFDPELMRRGVGSLLQNALEAGRNVVVSVSEQERTVKFLHRSAAPGPVPKGRYVAVEIRDDGLGLHPSMEPRLFKPLASTKGPGRGLGLAATAEIAASHGSYVELQSGATGLTARLLIPIR